MDIGLSIIIPVGSNRLHNLNLVLTSLEGQTYQNFEVIVVNDGGDDVSTVLRAHRGLNLTYIYTPRHESPVQKEIEQLMKELPIPEEEDRWRVENKVRIDALVDRLMETKKVATTHPRNRGARNAMYSCFVFADSDVILCPKALEYYAEDFAENSDRVVVGSYDWLRPMRISAVDVRRRFWDIIDERLDHLSIPQPQTHNVCADQRTQLFNETTRDVVWKATTPTERMSLYPKFLACFIPDTQIMTTTGLKNIADVSVGDIVYSINPTTGQTEFDTVIAKQHYFHDGNVVRLNGDHAPYDFVITPDHRLLLANVTRQYFNKGTRKISFYQRQDFSFIEARDIVDVKNIRYVFPSWHPKTGKQDHLFDLGAWAVQHNLTIENDARGWIRNREKQAFIPSVYDMRDWLCLVGWFVSEGSFYSCLGGQGRYLPRRGVRISQSNKSNQQVITDLLDRMGLPHSKWSKSNITIYSTIVAEYMASECGESADKKRLPQSIFELDATLLRSLYVAVMSGDGSWRNGIAETYNTISTQLAEDFLRLCVHLGIPAHLIRGKVKSSVKRKDGRSHIDFYTVRIRVLNNESHWLQYHNVRNEYYVGDVFCVTTEKNHTVLAGRNGKLQFIGQCFSGNIAFPANIFWDIGGYDDRLMAGIHEDGASGLALMTRGHGISFDYRIRGGHLYHQRNVARSRAAWYVEIPYINRRFRLEEYQDTEGVRDTLPSLETMSREAIRAWGVEAWQKKDGWHGFEVNR